MTEIHDPGKNRKRGDWRWLILAAFVLAALISRAGFAQLDRVVKWDESDYLMLGRNLLAGKGFTTAGYPEVHYPPLVPIVFGLAEQVVADPETASELVYILLGALLLLPLFGLAHHMYGTRVAYLALALMVIFAPLAVGVLYWGTMSEPLYLFLVFAGLYGLWRGLRESNAAYYALGGLMFALAYLARPEAILYFGIFSIFILIWHLVRRTFRERRTWLGLGAYVGAFALLALPYVIYLHGHTGKWTFSGKVGVTFELGTAVVNQDPAAYDIATASLDSTGNHIIWFSPERFQKVSMTSEVLSDPGAYLRRMVSNIFAWQGLMFDGTIFPYVALGIVLMGLCREAWSRLRTGGELFLLTALLPPFGFLALHIELRFFAPLFPILIIWTAKGADELGLWLHDTVSNWRERPLPFMSGQILRLLPFAGILIYFAAMLPILAESGQGGTDFGPRDVGLWIGQHTPAESRIMSRDVAVAVYADRAWVPSPHADLTAFLRYARYHDVNYIVITEREATVLRPALRPLLEEPADQPGLTLVLEVETSQGATLVYSLKEGTP